MNPVRRRALAGLAGSLAAFGVIYVLNALLDHSWTWPLLTLAIIFVIVDVSLWFQACRRR